MGFSRFASGLFFRFSKWSLVIQEDLPRGGVILIGAPHTSNWDFALMLAISGQVGAKFHFLGKNTLFRGPMGSVMRALGGIPVDRSTKNGLVSDLVERIHASDNFVLAITPKGTRGKREYWRSGFYRIAQESGLPLQMCFVDAGTNTTGVGPLLHVTGDVSADMDKIREFFADKVGIRPELTSIPRLRMEEEE